MFLDGDQLGYCGSKSNARPCHAVCKYRLPVKCASIFSSSHKQGIHDLWSSQWHQECGVLLREHLRYKANSRVTSRSMNCQAEGSHFTAHRLSLPTNCQRDKKRNKRLNKITILSRSCCDQKAFIFLYFQRWPFASSCIFHAPTENTFEEKKGLGRKERKRKCPAVYSTHL